MNDLLKTHLHDHLAGSRFALDLVQAICDRFKGSPLGEMGAWLLPEIEQDRAALERIADRFGPGLPEWKEALSWVAEKFSKLKLGHGTKPELGTYEALETLALGISGKLSLWQALETVADHDERLNGEDYSGLQKRAWEQHDRVEVQRLSFARKLFGRPPGVSA